MESEDMTKIEQIFCDAVSEIVKEDPNGAGMLAAFFIKKNFEIGIYTVPLCIASCVIEIDENEYKKTREQREYEIKKERYLLKQGYTPIHFLKAEVFSDAKACAFEVGEIILNLEKKWWDDLNTGRRLEREKSDIQKMIDTYKIKNKNQ